MGEELSARGNEVMLIASRKDVDRENAKGLSGFRIEFLPVIALTRRRLVAFAWGMMQAIGLCLKWFMSWRPDVVLVMGGFTSVAPAIVGRMLGARIYLHEANSIPGRANRLIAKWCHGIFVGFSSTQTYFPGRPVMVVGTPVRHQFSERLSASAYEGFGLDSSAPVLLVMGGSQGAQGINHLMLKVVPILAQRHSDLQFFHLAGRNECDSLDGMYRKTEARYFLSEFCSDTSVPVRMASAAVSRAGASSLAEFSSAQLPSLLVPYPAAADDHQRENALIFCKDGAALMVDQEGADPDSVAGSLEQLLYDRSIQSTINNSLKSWDPSRAARRMADDLVGEIAESALRKELIQGGQEQANLRSGLESGSEKIDVRQVPAI